MLCQPAARFPNRGTPVCQTHSLPPLPPLSRCAIKDTAGAAAAEAEEPLEDDDDEDGEWEEVDVDENGAMAAPARPDGCPGPSRPCRRPSRLQMLIHPVCNFISLQGVPIESTARPVSRQ